jgi:hypothetical protein
MGSSNKNGMWGISLGIGRGYEVNPDEGLAFQE